LIEIGSKMAEKNSAQTDRQTDRHYENNGHLAVNQYNKIYVWMLKTIFALLYQQQCHAQNAVSPLLSHFLLSILLFLPPQLYSKSLGYIFIPWTGARWQGDNTAAASATASQPTIQQLTRQTALVPRPPTDAPVQASTLSWNKTQILVAMLFFFPNFAQRSMAQRLCCWHRWRD